MLKYYWLSLFFFCCCLSANGQKSSIETSNALTKSVEVNDVIHFNNQNQLLASVGFNSVIIVGVADMNGDKLDDIIRLDDGKTLFIEYQGAGPHFDNYTFGDVALEGQWSLSVADVDANGFNDMMLGGNNDGVKLFLANNDGTAYSETTLPASSDFFVQGSNFADINGDGLIDVFVCNDNGLNRIWENTGGGNYVVADDWIEMATIPTSDNSGSYASAWTDFDNDGDLDLYISKCRVNVDEFDDPRRINQLFVNDGNNNYTEMAEEFGLKNGAQTWTSDFQDIDNDGDLDCFMINHGDAPSQLLLNDGTGHFEDITSASGLSFLDEHYQGILRDFDNDGFVDILAAGVNGYQFYRNLGNLIFTDFDDVFNDYKMGTFAIGDLNHDGFIDVYSGSVTNNDVLWINEKTDNNFFALNLTGANDQLNAIGARAEIYGDWGIQIREVRAGESYGITNSFTQYFGLGTATAIDSLVVRWPSGSIEVFENPQINQFLNVVENECAYPDCIISSGGVTTFCVGDTLVLSAPTGNTYAWSNMEDTPEIAILEGGTYQVTVTNDYGCTSVSNPIEITQNPDVAPTISASGATTFCFGQTVFLSSSSAAAYEWSSGQESQSIIVFQSGEYTVSTVGVCETLSSEPITIEVIPIPETPMVENDTILDTDVPAMGVLTATGNNVNWYDVPSGGNPLEMGNTFETPEISETTAFYVQDFVSVNNVTCSSPRVEALVVVDSMVGIPILLRDDLFVVYPNPGGDFIWIQSEQDNTAPMGIQMFDTNGHLVFSHQKKEPIIGDFQIETRHLPSGMYTLLLETDQGRYYKKVLIQQ